MQHKWTLLIALLLAPVATLCASTTEIRLDSQTPGRLFEGVGAVSAGASTRNLVDYPLKQRCEVLDYLFKPKFGAGLQHLKVEVGGGENSTCGSEPSHVITRDELASPKARGYEFWLMAEARSRNPQIQLDCLPWCYPYWISGRFSQDSADWLVAFLDVARKQYHLEIDWLAAAQNEAGTDLNWVTRTLRPTLDKHGYEKVKLQGPDDVHGTWKIFDELAKNPSANATLQAIGYHYLSFWLPDIENDKLAAPEAVKATGKPLWSSEEFSYSGKSWEKALLWARLLNKLYIRDRITKVEAWCPVDAIYPGIPYAGTGLMQANQPWTGHYEVWPAIWTTAHTTQFAEPGWRYMDRACGRFDTKTWRGSYVTLRNPKTGDWSLIACTHTQETMRIVVDDPNLKRDSVRVWKSTAEEQFVPILDVAMVNGQVELTLEKDAVYSVTTTAGQSKGNYANVPELKPFPLPYKEDFEQSPLGVTPRYLSDQKGTFETVRRSDGGICLQQIVRKHGIEWRRCRTPYTVWGDNRWKDYTVKVDVLIRNGSVEVGGRFNRHDIMNTSLVLHRDGKWELISPVTVDVEKAGRKTKVVELQTLASGSVAGFQPDQWHALQLTLKGATATASIDGKIVGQGAMKDGNSGMPYIASSYDPNCFDNVEVIAETASMNFQ